LAHMQRQVDRAAGKALLIPAEAVARRHHTLTSDRAATFAAVAAELVTLLDAELNTSEVQAVQQLVTLDQWHHSSRLWPHWLLQRGHTAWPWLRHHRHRHQHLRQFLGWMRCPEHRQTLTCWILELVLCSCTRGCTTALMREGAHRFSTSRGAQSGECTSLKTTHIS
jgi:hypothetical protein